MTTNRRGLSLIELLIGMIITAILGGATLSLMISQSRSTERSEGQRDARRVARGAINALGADLPMVDPSWGIEAASATSITVRVPYALGVICSSTATLQILAILPVDSVTLATPGYSGYATRGATGVYTPVGGGAVTEEAMSATCTGGSSRVTAIAAPLSAPNQKTRQMRIVTIGATVIPIGTPVMLYRRTEFYFAPSAQAGIAGRNALWRRYVDANGSNVELAAPFDATAAFRFYLLDATTAQVDVPLDLTETRGIEVFLPGESDASSRVRGAPEQANLTTSFFFVNRSE